MPVTDARETTPREGPHYPQSGTHTWGAFAGLAIEMDGYGGVEVIAPWSGRVLYVPDVFYRGESEEGGPELPELLRRVAAGIEAAGWTGE